MAKRKKKSPLSGLMYKIPIWAGTPLSVWMHTILFVGAFALVWMGVDFDRVMLALTTVVSLEAIYLSLFIQMTVNRHHKKIRDIEEDIDDILEDTKELTDEIR